VYSFSTSARPALSWRISMSMACITSSGSNPAITTGRSYSSAKNSYGLVPMTALTWAGPMKPSTATVPSLRTSGLSKMLVMPAGVSTWLQNTLKFPRPSSRARLMATAVVGAVVSNPMAKNRTWPSGLSPAILTASRLE
jgi:hypothetical protein